MLSWLKQNLNSARATMATEVAKFRNKDFMEAVVAGCALVAASDGNITSEEKQKMAGFLQRSEELKVFEMKAVIEVFNRVAADFDFDASIGKATGLRMIAKAKGNPDQARLLVRVVCAIGAADGDFDAKERAVVAEICKELGLNPAEFDL